jgi:hypothetical protein
MGILRAATFPRTSETGGQPTGTTASATDRRMSPTASPSRKIWTSCPASANAWPWEKGKAALVGSSEPQALFSMILSGAPRAEAKALPRTEFESKKRIAGRPGPS